MYTDYLLLFAAIVVGWIVVLSVMYSIFRGGIAMRLTIVFMVSATVVSILSFALGIEGINMLRSGIALLIALPILIGSFMILIRQIITPIKQMAIVTAGIAEGDLDQMITVKNKDEIGEMAASSTQMIAYLQNMADAATRLAQGDVTTEIVLQSDRDVLGLAFRQMVNYQQQMVEAANCLAQGDLTTQVTPQNEADALGHAFRQMNGNLRNLIGQVQQSASQVANASQQLNASADQAGQASQQVSSSIQQIAGGANQQTEATTEATKNMEQMARAAAGIARGAQEQAQGIQKTSALIDEMGTIVERVGQATQAVTGGNAKVIQSARQGVTAVEQSSRGMDSIRVRTVEAMEKVKEMEIRSKEISRIVDTIDEIADKTDMLALNAAVEAARAGDHGRGFAVVAEQVRKLSEDSKSATGDIDKLIERVQASVTEAIAAMGMTASEVDHGSQLAVDTSESLLGILQSAEEAGAMADRIVEAVAALKEKSGGVVSAMELVSAVVEENTASAEQMAANSQEVNHAMSGVASVAEENSASVEEVSASAEEMSAQIEEVVASAEELSALAEELRYTADQFQLNKQDRFGHSTEVLAEKSATQQSSVRAEGLQGNGYREIA